MTGSRVDTSFSEEALPVVILTGFMGTGKTETGRELADLLGLGFLDLDECIEEREGMKVVEIFQRRGEGYFRAAEEDACAKLNGRSGLVVATGGGTVLNDRNLKALSRAGKLVLLKATSDEIIRRIGNDGRRPLLGARPAGGAAASDLKGRVEALLASRELAYSRISSAVDTTGLSPKRVASRVAASLDLPAVTIDMRVGDGGAVRRAVPPHRPAQCGGDHHQKGARTSIDLSEDLWDGRRRARTKIMIGRGLLSKLGDILYGAGLRSKVFVLIAERVREIFLEQIAASLESASIEWDTIPVADGDSRKNMRQVEALLDALASRAAERDSVVMAVGGGVTGDLAGFTASIYMRGIPLVQVPTTLLAQVDSSIGGKVGVNHALAKNLAGSFHQPNLVVSDPCALRTLPPKEIANGMAEVIKTAIVGSPELFAFLEAELLGSPYGENSRDEAEKLRDVRLLERCVAECGSVKARIVERDPYDRGARRSLNLGHTLGHALEAAGSYSGLTHGEAVSIGLVAALRISQRRGLAGGELLPRARRLLARCGLPVAAPALDGEAIVQTLALDKKRASGRPQFVIVGGLGSTSIVDDVTERELLESLRGEMK